MKRLTLAWIAAHLPGGPDVYPDTQLAARIVGHPGLIFLAVITVNDPVPVDTLLLVRRHTGLAALYRS